MKFRTILAVSAFIFFSSWVRASQDLVALPDELLVCISGYLPDLKSLSSLSRTCQKFKEITSDGTVVRDVYRNHLGRLGREKLQREKLFSLIESGMVDEDLKNSIQKSSIQFLTSSDEVGRTALHIAATAGNLEITQILVEKLERNPARIFITEENSRTPLHLAVLAGHTEIVRFLLGFLDHSNRITQQDRFGGTPLQAATEKGDQEVIQLLTQAISVGSNYLP
jgi:hypothetical protein